MNLLEKVTPLGKKKQVAKTDTASKTAETKKSPSKTAETKKSRSKTAETKKSPSTKKKSTFIL